jgi:predicted urease superfamily metal-dependent hydrolase
VGGSSNGSKAAGQGQQPGYWGQLERPVPYEVFEVLSAMLNSILEVAAAQDDSRVVLTVLELASVISCTTGAGAGANVGLRGGMVALHAAGASVACMAATANVLSVLHAHTALIDAVFCVLFPD